VDQRTTKLFARKSIVSFGHGDPLESQFIHCRSFVDTQVQLNVDAEDQCDISVIFKISEIPIQV
jgi:hypothetical protein